MNFIVVGRINTLRTVKLLAEMDCRANMKMESSMKG